MTVTALLTAQLLLLAVPLCHGGVQKSYPITLTVFNTVLNTKENYTTTIAYRGILLGAMRTLMMNDSSFKFTVKEDHNYGPYLVSVNGVAENQEDNAYWLLMVENADGSMTGPDVGVGCYIPKPNEHIILKYTKL